MKTWIGIGVVIGLALILGLGSILYRNLGSDFTNQNTVVLTNDLARYGFEVAKGKGCVACHTLDGSTSIGPTWKGMYGRSETLTDGSIVVADEVYIRESILDPGAKMVEGFPNVMITTELTAEELEALMEFTRQLGQL